MLTVRMLQSRKILDVAAYFLKECCDCLFKDCEIFIEMLVLLLLTN